MSTQEIEDALKRFSAKPNVLGVMITDEEGSVIKTTFDASLTKLYSEKITTLVGQAQDMVRDMDENETNDMTFLRVRTKKHEILVRPDGEYFLMVLQKPEKFTDN